MPSLFKRVEKRPLYRDEVKSTILDMIISGKLKPGSRVVETQWAKRLGVSQSPVREAIQELEMLDVVEKIPYKGTFVRNISPKEIRDAYVVRAMLESNAITDAVQFITDEQLQTARTLLDKMRESAGMGDHQMYVNYDAMFHGHFMEISPNQLLKRLWSQCSIHGATQIGTSFSQHALLTLADRHINICTALESRDASMAHQAVTTHFNLLIDELNLPNNQ